MSEFVKVASTDEVGPGSCKTFDRQLTTQSGH